MKERLPNTYRRYGSLRILKDGRIRFSPWTYPVLSYLSFLVSDDYITVETSGRQVLSLDLSRGRVRSACFPYNLTSDELRRTIATLRRAGRGIERWIVPGLEFSRLAPSFQENNPETYAMTAELLESCRDLPVAEQWKRVREQAFANAASAAARLERARSRNKGK